MRFLVDAQLPPSLAALLVGHGPEAEHVHDVGLGQAADEVIWKFAETRGAIVLTKDEDFAVLSELKKTGPTIVWIRIGNTTKTGLMKWFEPLLPSIVEAIERGKTLVELV